MHEVLHQRFRPGHAFHRPSESYELAPFRFTRIPGVDGKHLVVNEIGESHFLSEIDFRRFIARELRSTESLYLDLRSKHFILDDFAGSFRPFAAAQFRSRKNFVFEGAGLHIFVVTLRCDHSCGYCQVSRRSTDAQAFDMSSDTATQAIDRLFESPSNDLKVEFQGGESTLAFDRVKWIVEAIETRNAIASKRIEFALATTLSSVDRQQLEFCRDHNVHLSTSLDGPRELHNRNRPKSGRDSFERTIDGIERARQIVGQDSVSALLTVTRATLAQPEAVIDTYVSLGFPSIFIRSLSNHGFARRSVRSLGYSTDEFLSFYDRALAHLCKVNASGHYIEESYTTLLLEQILTPFSNGYVDLRSPTGAGFGALVYNYDGFVYPSDEARMLVEIGDTTFRLGHVSQPYGELMCSPVMKELLQHGVAEALPVCSDCAFVPYCGADPINHWAHHRTMSGAEPESNFCQRQTHLFNHLFKVLHDGPGPEVDVLMSWLTRRKMPRPTGPPA